MSFGRRFDRLSRTIGTVDEGEKKVQFSFRLNESVVASINSVAKATGVSKTEILNQVLEIGLTELVEALQVNRPDLITDVIEDAAPVYEFMAPQDFRAMRNKFGDSLQFGDAAQLDIEEAIQEQEAAVQSEEEQ